jgi:hypothetical protein
MPSFPLERGADELRRALKDAQGYLEAARPSAARFSALAQPYGPLDLELRGAHTAEEGGSVKNFFLGAAGYASGLSPADIQGMVRGFFTRHGRLAGKTAWLASLPAQRDLVARFRTLDGAAVLAQWGADEYRVGDLFKVGDQFWTCAPTPTLGLAPWGERTQVEDPLVAGTAAAASIRAAEPVLAEMRRLGVRALVRMRSGAVRVVQDGIADNEVGTLFLPPEATPPRRGEELSDGKPLLHTEAVAPGVFYYLAG